ncbi:hypothetical protein HELRODRAFT_176001 [Helobdella robusta]|uniref:Uncharacterized protein n=1 Tax=Helobdella robusta TaxID=6412 RepID=T1FA06_HELRO|nr:hypothetical protein HELRODRAFT_176001 [Helobdella robusta]ESO00174.1 hypothetical protein HELRODRAFT_176001 [Helobdella robusta]
MTSTNQKETQKVIVYPSRRITNEDDQQHQHLSNFFDSKTSAVGSNSPLYDEKEGLKEQLDNQLKINADLKKLLVASIGDDLHNKVEALVRKGHFVFAHVFSPNNNNNNTHTTPSSLKCFVNLMCSVKFRTNKTKVQLTSEVNAYTNKLLEDYESIDKLSILVDMWYSKFQASRLLINQLTSDRDTLLNLYLQSKNAIQYTIDERQYLYKVLSDTNKMLLDLLKMRNDDTNAMSTLELVEYNKVLVEKLNPNQPDTSSTTESTKYTCAERLANEVIDGKISIMSQENHRPLPRFHPKTKYYGVTFNCCKNCKGNVLIV